MDNVQSIHDIICDKIKNDPNYITNMITSGQSLLSQLERITGYGITNDVQPKCCDEFMALLGYNIDLNGNMFECKICKRKKFYTFDEYYRMMNDTYGQLKLIN